MLFFFFFPLYADFRGQLHTDMNHLGDFKAVSLQCIFVDSRSCCLLFTSRNPRLTEVNPIHQGHTHNVGYSQDQCRSFSMSTQIKQ